MLLPENSILLDRYSVGISFLFLFNSFEESFVVLIFSIFSTILFFNTEAFIFSPVPSQYGHLYQQLSSGSEAASGKQYSPVPSHFRHFISYSIYA